MCGGDLMLEIGQIYRQSSKIKTPSLKLVDGLPNYYNVTHLPEVNNSFAFQKGIHQIRKIQIYNGEVRCPLIIISSSPHKAGTEQAPWKDKYSPDHGYVKYYGDNKSSDTNPGANGNKILLDLLNVYNSNEKKIREEQAVPIVFFERTSVMVGNKTRYKGNLVFQGYGVLESAELITQYDNRGKAFSNYLFYFCIFTLKEDNEKFDWKWIGKRSNKLLSNKETNRYAPKAWQKWIEQGKLDLVRRSVADSEIIKPERQKDMSEKESKLLKQIYDYYFNKKHEFESLAMDVAMKTIQENGGTCIPGWITQKTSDHGIDFVFRMDIGQAGLSAVKIVVLGQAKCEKLNSPTNGRDIARTVARLKRGWVGVYVTTSYFSESVQKEVIEDSYPIMLINGKIIAEVVHKELVKQRMHLITYLDQVGKAYSRNLWTKQPEDVLLDK